ncbi:hypothetical protein RBSH_00999 [Rhodopirellula baltica SH28]|uniref:Uncharacterized protein n=1 Tax=Rhodopirellula baltica SH28 TaxID=993517 RepID=K5CHP1_RHOBT|nr:hypothetical protein RBSH_00999 [Rhodopirellula baltica SH28]
MTSGTVVRVACEDSSDDAFMRSVQKAKTTAEAFHDSPLRPIEFP